MGFSRNSNFMFTEEEMAEMNRPLTKKEEAKLLKEFNKMRKGKHLSHEEMVKLKYNIDGFN